MNKRARIDDSNKALVNVWKREVGELSTRNFAHRLGASQVLLPDFPLLLFVLSIIFSVFINDPLRLVVLIFKCHRLLFDHNRMDPVERIGLCCIFRKDFVLIKKKLYGFRWIVY